MLDDVTSDILGECAELKWCNKCKKLKSKIEFYARKAGLQPKCKECCFQTSKKWQQNNKDRYMEISKRWQQSNPLKVIIHSSKMSARHKKLEHTISIDWLVDMIKNQNNRCAITGIEFNSFKTNARNRPFIASIDRIDCSKGYIPENCRIVCCIVNIALNDFGLEIFDQIVRARMNMLQCSKDLKI